MDLNATIAYNGFSASGLTTAGGGGPAYGTVFNRVNFSNVDVSQYIDKRAVQDGVDAADVYYGARKIDIDASIFGSTRGHSWDQLASFMQAFDPILAYNADTANIGFLAFQYYRPTAIVSTWATSAYPNGIPLQMYLRPMSKPTFTVDRQATGGVSGNSFAIAVQASLFARDPRQYLQTAITVTLSTATQTASYRGDFPSWPVVTFAMSAAGSSAQVFTVGGGSVQLDLSATSSGTYTITYSARTITDADGALSTSMFDSSATQVFNQVQSGTTLYVSGTTGMSSCTLTYREAFT